MDKFELLDKLIAELGLTPLQIVERWLDNGTCDQFALTPVKSRKHSNSRSDKSGTGTTGDAVVAFKDENKQRIFTTLRPIIADVLNIDSEVIQPMSNFSFDLGADSLDEVEMFQQIEREFKCSITDGKTAELRTVKSVVYYLADLGK